MFGKYLEAVRSASPLVHCMTNYVTVNDCANMLLASGGSPIMSDEMAEVAEITSICSALDINIGTLNRRTIEAMLAAGVRANELGHPVLLDPVGAGASTLRTSTARDMADRLKPTVIRANMSEMKALASGGGSTRGVDADLADAVTDRSLSKAADFAKAMSARTGAIIAITGAIDIVADAKRAFAIRNGHPLMAKVSGTGCMLSAVTCAFVSASPDNALEATAAAVCAMGLCGQKAAAVAAGTGSLRVALIDAMSSMSAAELDMGEMVVEL